MSVTIAVLSQKGGTGKTTTVRSLADVLTRTGLDVLAIDADPQGNLSDYFDVDPAAEPTLADVLAGQARAADAVHGAIVPANLGLAESELMLAGKIGREVTLRRALMDLKRSKEMILIDCPPALNMLTVNALVAADSVLVPMQCEYYALEGLSALVGTIDQIRDGINPNLEIEGILRTMFDPRNNLSNEVAAQLIEHFGEKVFRTVIPRNVRLAEAPSFGKPALFHDKESRGALAYLALAGEMLRREDGQQESEMLSKEDGKPESEMIPREDEAKLQNHGS